MKKFFISLIGAACFTVIVASCNKQEGVEVAPTQEKEPTSIIDLMEKEEGVKFFRRDIWLKDTKGENQVLMRFAATDKDMLDAYLAENEYSISPISAENIIVQNTFDQPKANNQKAIVPTVKQMIITEVLDDQLVSDIRGYVTNVKRKPNGVDGNKKSRISSTYSSFATHVSMNWPTYYRVYGQSAIRHSMRIKDRWMNAWSEPLSLIEQPNPNTLSYYRYDIDTWWDGPWRARLEIDYNNSNDYSFYFDRY